MNILILNQDWFAKELRERGHHVLTVGTAQHLDRKLETPLIHVDRIIEMWMQDNPPDRIVVLDNSAPIMIQGLDETTIPTLFYSVDTHHHADLHKYLCNVFDETLIAQVDYLPIFTAVGHSPRWLPLWASRHIEPSSEKKYGAVFVGTLNPKLNRDRVTFFEALKEKAPIHFQSGNFWEIFPHAEIVINQTVKGDLNFRVFEAMMSGATLLTERAGNGLLDLFRDGEHLVCYTKNDVNEAAAKIHELLGDRERCREIGRRGREEILRFHTAESRINILLDVLSNLKKKSSSMKHFSAMINFASLAVRMEKLDTGLAGRAFLAALKAADYGLSQNEKLNEDLACFLVISCLKYERLLRSGAGNKLLLDLGERQPDIEVLSLARIRILLNDGDKASAEVLAKQISSDDVYKTFLRSEELVGRLLTLSDEPH